MHKNPGFRVKPGMTNEDKAYVVMYSAEDSLGNETMECGHRKNGRIMSHRTVATPFARSTIWAALAFLVALGVGCATTKPSLDDTALAFVNGEPVTVKNLDETFESSHQGHGAFLAGAGAVRQFLDKTVDRRLLIQEGRRIGLDQDPEIRHQVKTLVTQRARDQLYKDEVTSYRDVPEKAIETVYPKILYRYRLRHILTYTRPDGVQAVARIRAGEPFGAVAGEVSVSSTAGKGGDLGFVIWGQLDPRLEAEIETMQPGEIRGPIETDQGWNVLLLEEKEQREEEVPELAKLRYRIKMTLGQHAMSRVEIYRHAVQPAFLPDRIQDFGRGCAITVIGNQQRIRRARVLPRRQDQLAPQV